VQQARHRALLRRGLSNQLGRQIEIQLVGAHVKVLIAADADRPLG
jgi:hypothetical protein